MNERIIKILTNSGYKYQGQLISQNSTFVELEDVKLGRIQVPLTSICFLKEVLD